MMAPQPIKKMWSEIGIVGTINDTKHYFEHPLIPHKKVYAFSDFIH